MPGRGLSRSMQLDAVGGVGVRVAVPLSVPSGSGEGTGLRCWLAGLVAVSLGSSALGVCRGVALPN